MPTFFKFLLRRLLVIPVTLLVITAALYAVIMLTPPEIRAELYIPRVTGNPTSSEAARHNFINNIIASHGLNDPYPIQYGRWLVRLMHGEWGYSRTLQEDVLEALVRRTPATVELTLVSLLLLVPLGVLMGGLAGARKDGFSDLAFRSLAFLATSTPTFILGLMMVAVFYVAVRWFPPGRLGLAARLLVLSESFTSYTGLLTLDGLLNLRPDVSLNALRHLIAPALTLSFAHWATLGRVTRASLIDELSREYVIAARARGATQRMVVWRHALRNTLAPALTSSALSAASLITGVFIVEAIFSLPGVSEMVTGGLRFIPDAPAALGFAVYSVLLVLPVMLILDILKALVDPRVRAGVMS